MSKSKRIQLAAVLLVCVLPMVGCSTMNLARWGYDKTSCYNEPEKSLPRSFLKPTVTFFGLPVAFAWDVATFPLQAIFQVYPYGSRHMVPGTVDGI